MFFFQISSPNSFVKPYFLDQGLLNSELAGDLQIFIGFPMAEATKMNMESSIFCLFASQFFLWTSLWGSTMPPGLWDAIQPLLVYQKRATKHDRSLNTKKF